MQRTLKAGLLLAWIGFAPAGWTAERLALVVGNGGYQDAPVLANTGHDAQAVADALRKLGFTLDGGQPYRDLSRTQLEQVLKAFGPRARDAEAVVVYYAGHGVESGGANYLVPVDAELQHEVHLPLETVALDTVLEQIAGPRGWRLVILDACRNNPLAARMVRGAGGRGVTRGLARVEPQGQTYIAYAARGGTEALDQDPAGSDHSPFAAVLLDYLSQPLPLERLFGAVREDVLKRTGGQQEPWLYGAFGRDPIYLTGGDNREQETLFWNRVKDSRNPAVFRVYLRHFPGGVFADQARVRLAKLGGAEPPPPSDRELAFWHSVKDSPNPADFRAYLDQYPAGVFAKLAQNRLDEMEETARKEEEKRRQAAEEELRQREAARQAELAAEQARLAEQRQREEAARKAEEERLATRGTVGPSFDCRKAEYDSERMICSSAELSSMDIQMADAYRSAAARLTTEQRIALRKAQNYWLRKVRDRCRSEACLADEYRKRIQELEAYYH